MSTYLAQRPRRRRSYMIFWFIYQRVLQRLNPLCVNNTNRQGLIKSSDISERHNSWKSSITLSVPDVVHQSGFSSGVGDQLRKLRRLFSNFSNACSSVLTYKRIDVLQAIQNSWEDFSLNHNISKFHCVFRDLSQTTTDVSFKLGIRGVDQRSQERNSTCIDDHLS